MSQIQDWDFKIPPKFETQNDKWLYRKSVAKILVDVWVLALLADGYKQQEEKSVLGVFLGLVSIIL